MTNNDSKIWVSHSLKKEEVKTKLSEVKNNQSKHSSVLVPYLLKNQSIFYLVSLARIIGIESKNASCFSILIFKDKLYFARNSETSNSGITTELLDEFQKNLLEKKDTMEVQKRIWEKVLEKTKKGIGKLKKDFPFSKASNNKKQKMLENYQATLKEEITAELQNFNDAVRGMKPENCSLPLNADLLKYKTKLEALFCEFIRKELFSDTVLAKKCFSLFEATLALDDYIKVFEDLENFKKNKQSQLASAWSVIKTGNFIAVPNPISEEGYRHSELAIVQFIYNEDNSNLEDLLKAGTLAADLENHLVSSLWQCFSCWNTFDIASKHFTQKKQSKSLEVTGNLNPRHGFYKLYPGWTALYLEKNDDSKTIRKSCEDYVEQVITKGVESESKFIVSNWNHFNNLYEKNWEITKEEQTIQTTEIRELPEVGPSETRQ